MAVMIQPSIFDQAPVHRGDPDTSRQAAKRAESTCELIQSLILQALAIEPLTDDELTEILQRAHPERSSFTRNSIGTRRGTLVKLGYVVKTSIRRVNERGNPAVAWALNPERTWIA